MCGWHGDNRQTDENLLLSVNFKSDGRVHRDGAPACNTG